MAGFSLALLVAGSAAPTIGGWIDRYGGHVVMAAGSLIGACGIALLAFAAHPAAYLGVWVILGIAIAANLYDPAFATLGRIFGIGARRPITYLTLAGGFASTASWPATQLSLTFTDWRGTYLIFAAVLALVAAPLHAFALPRTKAAPPPQSDGSTASLPATVPAHGLVFFLVAAAFAAYAFIPSGLAAHLIAMFGRAGIDPATAVMIGALFGPSQVAARVCELFFGGRAHPLNLARFSVALILAGFALLALFGFALWAAIAFAIMFGAANGLLTIARGAVPLALFGATGYGRVLGRIAKPFQVMQAVAPLALAFAVERSGDPVALLVTAAFGVVSLLCLVVIRRPKAG
jgi:predicted MFS family arabinose efflux permease